MSRHQTTDDVRRRGTAFWLGVVIGWALIIWGLRGILHHHRDTRPQDLAYFFVRGPVVHDLVLVPLVLLVGAVIARTTPARWRAGVQAALLVCACLALFSYPEVRGYAHILNNPTSLPYNYTANLAVAVGIVVVVTIAILVVQGFRSRAQRHPE